MPPIGFLVGGVGFQDLALRLNDEVVIRYGSFLTTVINFIIVAFAMFLVVRVATADELPLEVVLLQEIRNLLAAQTLNNTLDR